MIKLLVEKGIVKINNNTVLVNGVDIRDILVKLNSDLPKNDVDFSVRVLVEVIRRITSEPLLYSTSPHSLYSAIKKFIEEA